jgi:hypothetical protein
VNSTPLWVPLLVAAMGTIGTVLAVVLTQRRSDQREAAAWDRERQRQRDLWAREDQLRNFELKRELYVDFYVSVQEMARVVYEFGAGEFPRPEAKTDGSMPTLTEVTIDWNWAAYHRCQSVRLFAPEQVSSACLEAYYECFRWGDKTVWDRGSGDERFQLKMTKLRETMRCDLGIEDDD